MKENYDVIVIGSGLSGLITALTLQKKGKKVLVLEKGKLPGGVATSFMRGRFTFDVGFFGLLKYGSIENKGELYELWQRLNIDFKINMKKSLPIVFFQGNEKQEYSFPSKMDDFVLKMEEYVPNSKDSIISFFGLCEDIKEALGELENKEITEQEIQLKYPNFVQLASQKVLPVLEKLNMPKKAMELLTSVWVYFGTSIKDLSFVSFALWWDSYVHYGLSYPQQTYYDITATLQKELETLGGKVLLLEPVTEIVVVENQVTQVKTNKDTYDVNEVIASVSPAYVYEKLIPSIPEEVRQLENERLLGLSPFCIYLGLNISKEELKLPETFFLLPNTKHDETFKSLEKINNEVLLGRTYNNDENTTVLELMGFFKPDCFAKAVSKENYFAMKNMLAEHYLSLLEQEKNIEIRKYIEEMDIATPVTFARYTNSPGGTIFGYLQKGYDNILSRIMNENAENIIKGLHFCGSFSSFASDTSNTMLNGEYEANKLGKE